MMEKIYYKSFLFYLQILLAGMLLYITVMVRGDMLLFLIMSLYAFFLYKSFQYWQKQRVGLAYFMTIAGYLTITFLQVSTSCVLH